MATPASPRKTLARFATPLLALAALGVAVSAHARPLMCGDTLYQSIALQANLHCGPGQDGLLIGADGVGIDLNGFTIRGAADPSTTGVRSYRFHGVQIVGPGSISGFEWAVSLQDGDGHRISNIEVPTGSVTLHNSSRSTVEKNDLSSLVLDSDSGGRTTGNVVTANEFTPDPVYPANAGLTMALIGCNTAENLVTGNNHPVASTSGGSSVGVSSGAHHNVISNNTVASGISIRSGASYNTVSGNVIASVGVELRAGLSFFCTGAMEAPVKNFVLDNEIYGAFYGIGVSGVSGAPAMGNQLHGNTIYNPGMAGIGFNAQAVDNDGRKNKVIARRGIPYAIDSGTGNLWP